MGIAAKYFVTDSVTGQPVTRTYYNSLGQKTRVETQRPDSSFLKTDYEYDELGRLVKQYEPYKTERNQFTAFEYDNFDRIISKTYPDGHSDTYTYNGLTTSSQVGGVISSRTIDELGNLVGVTDPGGSIIYSRTADGRPLSLSVNGEATTTFEYDSHGRKTAINDPSAGRITYSYDSGGNISTITDARGKKTATTYNAFGNPTSCTIGDDMTVTYSYNTYGQPIAISCSNGNSKKFSYNTHHKLTSETINGFKKSYTYSGGNVVRIDYYFNNESLGSEQYVRTRGTVTAINYGGKTLWRLDSENDRAKPTAISSSVVSTELDYDELGRVTSRTAATSASGTFQDMQYEFDIYGNMTDRNDGFWGTDEEFGYDDLNRLISTPAGEISYDGKGNIIGNDAAGVFSYASSRPYALSQISLGTATFPTATQHVSFNAMNRPDTIGEGSNKATFTYFEDGQRSSMTLFGNDCHNRYDYYDNQLTAININRPSYEGEKQVLFLGGDAYDAPAALVRERQKGASGWSQMLYYIVRDNLGSITHVVDSMGNVSQELSYDAWGRLRDAITLQPYAPDEQPELLLGRGYCGHEHLPQFNLINMNARLYDPWTARFLSPDPLVQLPDFTQSLNRYSYCLNNPLKMVDLNGENVWLIDKEGNKLLLLESEDIWNVILPEVDVTSKNNNYLSDFTDWSSSISFIGGATSTIWAERQYSQVFGYWTGLNNKIYYGLTGSGPNQITGSRKVAKAKAKKIRNIGKSLSCLNVASRAISYYDMTSKNNYGPNMQKYLLEKTFLGSSIDILGGFGNLYMSAFSFGYNLGEIIETLTGVNIQYNPYTKDFTPIEETLMQADELGIIIY